MTLPRSSRRLVSSASRPKRIPRATVVFLFTFTTILIFSYDLDRYRNNLFDGGLISQHVEMNKLKHISFPHGTFFFGEDSHQVKIPKNQMFDRSASWSSLQRELLDDESDVINLEEEKKRCASYRLWVS